MAPDGSFGADVAFLKQHTDVFVLSDERAAAIAVVPSMQGRVMTSSALGDEGASFGWINYDLIRSGEILEHMNAYGGEERFWLGPEGGQFSIYFEPGSPFDLEHWFVPAAIDTEAFDLVSRDHSSARFQKEIRLTNYSGHTLDIHVDREVCLLDPDEVATLLGVRPDEGLAFVAHQTRNTIKNIGESAWTHETGMVSIWILGMYNPSPTTTIVIPFVPGSEDVLGPIVNDAYFGKVPSDRLVTGDGVLFFKGDGLYRSKIGLSPARAMPFLGSYDSDASVLTIVHYNKPENVSDYVNSMWELQDEPFSGDVVNSYNDGPPEPGVEPMGPFFELESSSPAAALGPGEQLLHQHTTIHFSGPESSLDILAQQILGVDIETIKSALPQ
jgi:hypothetical protein